MSKGDILLLHGAFVGGWVFEKLRAELNRRGWKTHAPDLPFHDSSFAGQEPHPDLAKQGIAEYRRFVENEIHRLPPDAPKPVVIGHSLGGLLAQQMAAQNLVRAAVLLAPAAPWGSLPRSKLQIENATGLLWKVGLDLWHKGIKPDFQIAAAQSMDRIPPALQRDIFARMVPESGRVLGETMLWWLDWHAHGYVPAHRVTIPMLVLAGDDDKVIPPAACRAVAARYPGRAVYREIPELSHFIFGEPKEDEVIALTADWLDTHAT